MGSGKGFHVNKAVHLKAEALPHVKIRDWIIESVLSNGRLLLRYQDQERNYSLEVQTEDIEVKCCS